MKKICVISVSLFFMVGLPFALSPSKLCAEQRPPAEQPQDWESLPPEMKKFLLDLGKEQQKPERPISKEEAKKPELGLASRWLKLVDEGKYKDACEKVGDYELAAALGQHHEIDNCIVRLRGTRSRLGRVTSRKYISTEFGRSESILAVFYRTAFEKESVTESITLTTGAISPINRYQILGKFIFVLPDNHWPVVEFITSYGNILIYLFDLKAPETVNNFLSYVDDKFYDGTLFHRVIPHYIIQGGGFTLDMVKKSTRPPIKNEADNGLRNRRGTIAMTRVRDPHSATSQFFINIEDNKDLNFKSATPQGWGYAVFGEVIHGMEVVDTISVVPTTKAREVPKYPIVIKKARRFVGYSEGSR